MFATCMAALVLVRPPGQLRGWQGTLEDWKRSEQMRSVDRI